MWEIETWGKVMTSLNNVYRKIRVHRELIFEITGLLDFVHRLVLERTEENTTIKKLGLFPSSGEGEGEDIYSVGSLRQS
jgi:hypothetical protein